MKNIKIISYIIFICLVSSVHFSCEDQTDNISTPDFEVSVSQQNKAGENVEFLINGNPDIIYFYSGEDSNDYAYADKDRIYPLKVELSFMTQNAKLGATPWQEQQLSLKVVSDLDLESCATFEDTVNRLNTAPWIDLTDRFTLGPLGVGTYTESGIADLTEVLEKNVPLRFAFHYNNEPYTTHRPTIWRVMNFALDESSTIGQNTVLGQTAANWRMIFIGDNWTGSGTNIGSSVITMRGVNPTTSQNPDGQEVWCISNAVEIGDEINLGKDLAIGLKAASDIPLTSYKHIYEKPGTYIATFVAVNVNIHDKKEIIRQVEVVVE